MMHKKIIACSFVLLIVCAFVNARPQNIDSDIIERDVMERDADPGWIRRQLMRAGEAASRVGNNMGGFAMKLTNAVDKICGIIKKVIPIVGAVCTVGQFKFCALENVTGADIGGEIPIAGPGVVINTDLDALD